MAREKVIPLSLKVVSIYIRYSWSFSDICLEFIIPVPCPSVTMFLIFVIGVNYSIKQDNCSVFQHVCLAFCETESRKFLVGEFMDSVHLANLETALVQLKTRECLVPTGLLSHPDISKSDVTPLGNAISEHVSLIFEKTGILPTEVKKCKSCTSVIDRPF